LPPSPSSPTAPGPPRLSPPSLHDALPSCSLGQAPAAHEDVDRLTLAARLLQLQQSQYSVSGGNVDAGWRCSQDGPGGLCHRGRRSEEHTSELQSREKLVCRLLPENKKRHN